jgi:hypothetical protein
MIELIRTNENYTIKNGDRNICKDITPTQLNFLWHKINIKVRMDARKGMKDGRLKVNRIK